MSKIKNTATLATDQKRADALEILESGYQAIDTEKIIESKIEMDGDELCIGADRYTCHHYENIYIIGIGKCALTAAKVLEKTLGEKITDGIILDINEGQLQKMTSFAGSHPWPSEQNVTVTKKIVEMLDQVTDKDLVLVVISGGGSALLCLPFNTSCQTLVEVTQSMTKQGADIHELNTVRKHLSEVQGGQLAKLAYPAQVVSLIFSDVIGDDISVIASGPTVKDETAAKEAEEILKRYNLFDQPGKTNLLLTETPKEDKYFNRVTNFLMATNTDALNAMKEKAKTLGYQAEIISKTISGEARDVGAELAQRQIKPGQVLIGGGETTVKITGSGLGGRNQEMALSALAFLTPEKVLIAAASDGRDNSDVAGAIGDVGILETAEKLRLDHQEFLNNNDSYHFFKQTEGQLKTGPTGSNVADLFILLAK